MRNSKNASEGPQSGSVARSRVPFSFAPQAWVDPESGEIMALTPSGSPFYRGRRLEWLKPLHAAPARKKSACPSCGAAGPRQVTARAPRRWAGNGGPRTQAS